MTRTQRKRQIGSVDDLRHCGVHVRNGAVSDHEERPVDLLLRGRLPCQIGHLLDDLWCTKGVRPELIRPHSFDNAIKGALHAQRERSTYGTEVGGPREFDMAEGVRVGTNHVTDTDALGLFGNSGVRVFRCASAHWVAHQMQGGRHVR